MSNEFKKITQNNVTRYVLEDGTSGGATAGATGSSSIATFAKEMGEVRRRVEELQTKVVVPVKQKPRQGPLKQQTGAGAHKDKKKAAKQGDVKHKKPFAEGAENRRHFIRHNIWTVMDGDEEVLQHSVEGDPFFSAKKFIRDLDDQGYEFTHVVSPEGKITYLPHLDPRNFPKDEVDEEWSQKYKSSINCSHPKGFSQRAHCAGKKKHNEDMTMEAVCPDCGMCQTHGNVMEIKKGQKDANGFTRCWPGKHAVGTKKGKNGGQVRNCEPNEDVNGEYDDEAGMAYGSLHTLKRAVDGLMATIDENDNLPEWCQEKISIAEDYLVTVWDYLQSEKAQGVDPQQGVAEAFQNDESNLYYRYDPADGRLKQRMVHNNDERQAFAQGFKDTPEQALRAHGIVRSKFDPKKFVQKQGDKWVPVFPFGEPASESVAEVSPPGWEKTVKAMKKHDNIDNPYALAWSMKNKGYKSHKKESADPYFESLTDKLDDLKKK
jgi:hypothetical protein